MGYERKQAGGGEDSWRDMGSGEGKGGRWRKGEEAGMDDRRADEGSIARRGGERETEGR